MQVSYFGLISSQTPCPVYLMAPFIANNAKSTIITSPLGIRARIHPGLKCLLHRLAHAQNTSK